MNQVGAKDQCHPNESSQYLEKVADYVDFLKELKTDPSKVIVAGIMGMTEPFQVELRPPPGGGTGEPGARALVHVHRARHGPEVADPPTRIKFFLDQFPNRSTFTTICQQNLSDGLVLIAQLLKSVIGDPCIEGNLADVDPNTAGRAVRLLGVVRHRTTASRTRPRTSSRQCNAGQTNKPCWHIDDRHDELPGRGSLRAQDRARGVAAAGDARHRELRDASESSAERATTGRPPRGGRFLFFGDFR